MPRLRVSIGIGGGFINSVVQSHHALHAFVQHLGQAKSVGDALIILAKMDDTTFQGMVAYLLVLAAIWLPTVLITTKPASQKVPIPLLGLGAFGAILIAAMDIRFTLEVIWLHFHAASSLTQALLIFGAMDPVVVAGIAAYLVLVAATLLPMVGLVADVVGTAAAVYDSPSVP